MLAMRFSLDPKPLEFADHAPLRVTESALIRASRTRIFDVFADIGSWTRWFPLMYRAEWVSTQTAGVGAERDVHLHLLGAYRERFIAWEPGARFSFTMTASSTPMAHALLEDFAFTDEGAHTRVDWVLAADPRLLGKVGRPVLTRVMRKLFFVAGERLERYLGVS